MESIIGCSTPGKWEEYMDCKMYQHTLYASIADAAFSRKLSGVVFTNPIFDSGATTCPVYRFCAGVAWLKSQFIFKSPELTVGI
jgi:hypothetical protein